jgi:hypothetical protein
MKKLIIVIMVLLFLTSCKGTDDKEGVIVEVNGDVILDDEIMPVYEQCKEDGITYQEIVENSIDELIVIQQADKFEIFVDEGEVKHNLEHFKHSGGIYYDMSEELYTEEELLIKLKRIMLYQKTKEYVYETIIPSPNMVSEEDVNGFIEFYELGDYFEEYKEEYSEEEIIEGLWTEISDYLFYVWVQELREEAEITYYEN